MFQKLKTFITGKDANGHISGFFATPTTAETVLRMMTDISSELYSRAQVLVTALKNNDPHIPSTIDVAIASLAEEYIEWEKCAPMVTNGAFNEVDMKNQDAWTKANLKSYQTQLKAAMVLSQLSQLDVAFSRIIHSDNASESVREIMTNVQYALSQTKERLGMIDTWVTQALEVIN